MATYTYDITLDFPHGVDSIQLQAEINASDYISPTVTCINTVDESLVIIFPTTLTSDEINELNNVVALHNPIIGDRFVQATATLDPKETTVIGHASDRTNTRSFDIYYTTAETYTDDNLNFHADYADDFTLTNSTHSQIINDIFTLKTVSYAAGANIAPNGVFSASSATQPVTNLNDGNASTIWYNLNGTSPNNQWIMVNMGKATSIHSIAFVWYTTAYYASTIMVECSSDNINWDEDYTFTNVGYTSTEPGASVGVYLINLPAPMHCQYYRFKFVACRSSVYVVLREIRLFEAVGSGYATNSNCTITNVIANRQTFTHLWNTINSVSALYTQPTGTSIKLLLSFDSQTSWVYWDGSAWVSSILANIATNSMNISAFNTLTDANFKSSGGILSGDNTINVAVCISTTVSSASPSVDKFLFNVTTRPFKQNVGAESVRLRFISEYQTEVKNLAADRRIYTINITIK